MMTSPYETEAGKTGNVPEVIRMARYEVHGMGSAIAALGYAVQTPVGARDGEEGVMESKCNAGLGVVPRHMGPLKECWKSNRRRW